jgi:hypothetical protein
MLYSSKMTKSIYILDVKYIALHPNDLIPDKIINLCSKLPIPFPYT